MVLTDLIGMPVDQLFQGLLLPVLIVFAILWALLNSIRVFDRKINTILAAALTIMAAMTPQFSLFTTYVAQLGTQVAIGAFALVFVVGAVAWALGRGKDIYYDHLSPSKRLEALVKKRGDYMEKMDKASDEGKDDEAAEWSRRIKEVDNLIQVLSRKR